MSHSCDPEALSPRERRLFRETIDVYNDPAFAEMYFQKWRNDLPLAQLAAFSGRVGPDTVVLDAGCGPGHHTDHLHRHGHHAIGIDLAPTELRLARTTFAGPDFVRADMLHTPFTESAFAGIWACASLMHLPHDLLPVVLQEFRRVVAHDGIIALTLTVETQAHVDRFGRFFECYPRSYLTHHLTNTGFTTEGIDQRTRDRTTEQEGHTAGWLTIIARKTR